ncbi:dimethyladenosine transferase 1, mitochondrial [Orussus abietinus]|uniref:dimethyladenosine transferase 1, mitochondrial n=1 Tax=Orussus abietinus TaxID=222816 RepID=UPI00062688E5|nr:dimethyladenosine transferase 1, mitochondrial [Orussus abietinus]
MSALRIPPLPSVRDLVKLYRIRAIKQLSQNFLMDNRLCDKIVKVAGKLNNAQVLEVGPGPGGLTRCIIKRQPKRLVVVEKDERFMPTLEMLADTFSTIGGKMDIKLDDIRSINMANVFSEDEKRQWDDICPKMYIIGNLPFNISTPLIIKWLKDISERNGAWSMGRARLTLTFQKEVAERLVAEPCEDQRCRLSMMAQAWTKPHLEFVIPGRAFVPKPDVDVGVVTFTPLVHPLTAHNFQLFEKVVRHIFSFRQKYCIKSIGTLFPPDNREMLAALMFKLSDLDPTTRPFQLSIKDMDKLCTAYIYLTEKHPEIKLYDYRSSHCVLPSSLAKNIQIEAVA